MFTFIKNLFGQPHMMIISDLDDIFVPLLDGFFRLPEHSVINK